MNLYLAGTVNEFEKLLAKKKYIVFFIIEIAICVLLLLIETALNRVSGGIIEFGAADMSLVMLTFFIQIYIPLIIFMASCDIFSSEIQDGTVKAVLMRPISRLKIFLSKITAVMLLAVGFLASLFLVTVFLEALFSGGKYNGTLEDYTYRVLQELAGGEVRLAMGPAQRTVVNGIPAAYTIARANSSSGAIDVSVFAYQWAPDTVYHFVTLTRGGMGIGPFVPMVQSIRRVTPAEAAAIRPRAPGSGRGAAWHGAPTRPRARGTA
jgi:hypothetical protein